MKRQTFKRQIVLVSGILIAAALFLYTIVLWMITGLVREDVKVHNESMMMFTVDQIHDTIHLPLAMIENADRIIGAHQIESEGVTEYLETIQRSYPYFTDIHLIDEEGTIVNSAPYDHQLVGSSVRFEPYYLGGDTVQDVKYWSEVYISRHTGRPTISVTLREEGYLIAVDMDLQTFPVELNSDNLFEEIYSISVLDKWGTYIIADDSNKVLERQRYPYFDEVVLSASMGEGFDHGLGSIGIRKLEDLEWYIVFEFDQSHMYQEIQKLSYWAVGVWIFVIGITALLLRRYFQNIYQDIHLLTAKTEAIAEGDLDEEATLKFIELERFNRAFDQMARVLLKRESEILELNTNLESLVKDRTYQLEELNAQLEEEIMDKEKAQEEIEQLNANLEAKVKERTKELEFINGVLEHEALKAQGANDAKSRYLSILSHEIRTPLSSISGFLQMLTSTKLNREQREFASLIKEATKGLMATINDVLDVEKFAAGKMTYSNEAVHLDQLIRKIIEPYKHLARSKGIEVNLVRRFSEELHISVDPLKLEQVFNNLLSNAIKFTEQGSIDIDLKATQDSGRIHLGFALRDTGLGISEEVKPYLFKPYAQANASISKLHGGSGLGLSICKEIVEHYEGTIDFESSLGEGTVFKGYIYVDEVKEASKTSTVKTSPSVLPVTAPNDLKGKILVAEDNAVNQKLMKKFFDKHHVNYLIVDNGEEAVKACASEEISLILMDCQMPVMDGIEATEWIRKEEANKDIKIIAMTAYASKEDKRRCMDAGMDDFISKPIDLDHLEAVLGLGKNEVKVEDQKHPHRTVGTGNNSPAGSVVEDEIQRLMAEIHFDYETSSDLIHTFIKQMKAGIKEIEGQIISRDYHDASKKVHQLKGAAGAVRVERIRTLMEQMEASLKEQDVETLRKYITQVQEDPLLAG